MVLAVLVGAGAGLAAVGFRELVLAFTWLFTGSTDYSGAGWQPPTRVPGLGIWLLLFTPVIAGLIYGPLVYWLAPDARGHGVPEVMYAVAERDGNIPPRVGVVKAFASALCIGGGGSVGREGPIVQISSALGSAIGRMAHASAPRMRLLVACGAAGGIAATFNAPLAGPFFAMELLLRRYTVASFSALGLSSVAATVVGRALTGDEPLLTLPQFTSHHPGAYVLFLLLGLLVGAVGVGFSKALYLVEGLCNWVWRGPEWLRPAVGGLLLGGLLVALPQMYGVGYGVLEDAVAGEYAIALLLLLLVGKVVATSLTIGIGGSGGVFAPTLFIGAMAGSAFGQIAHHLFPTVAAHPGIYGLIGMGAALAGATRAPVTAVVILFEISAEPSVLLPTMLAVVVATLTSTVLSKDTIYTHTLLERGIDLDRTVRGEMLAEATASAAVTAPPSLVEANATLADVAERLSLSPHGVLPVVDDTGVYRGCVTTGAAAAMVGSSPVLDIVEQRPRLTTETALSEVLEALADHAVAGLPVLSAEGDRLAGWVTYDSVLAALRPHDAAV